MGNAGKYIFWKIREQQKMKIANVGMKRESFHLKEVLQK